MFIELHILQSFGPTNLNRDEDGNPKDCEFGGVRRARISSQCLKRAIRRSPTFARLTGVSNGVRTKRMAKDLRSRLEMADVPSDDAIRMSNEFANAYAGKSEKSKVDVSDETNVLIYISPSELDAIAHELKAGKDVANLVKEITKKFKGRSSAPDIALFGRMLADAPITNMDAAVQVAHAISTHRVSFEYDFFTAVDDLKPFDDPGAGMMGSIGYNSACYYRFARLDWNKLLENLGDDPELALRTVSAFLQASLDANPTGMQTSHDNQTPPALALAVIREDGGGWSLANAFESPVRASRDGGLIIPSVERLVDAYEVLVKNMDDASARVFALVLQPGIDLKSLADHQVTGRKAWNDAVLAALTGK